MSKRGEDGPGASKRESKWCRHVGIVVQRTATANRGNKTAGTGGSLRGATCGGGMDELAERLARGEAAAFAELYDACADRLHHYLTVRLGSRDEADDVLQETFVRLVRSRRRLRRVENLTAYLFAVARNEAARHGSRKTR